MTDSMIERVERAIKDNIQAALPEGVTVDYRYAARAAIEGMRPLLEEARDEIQWWADEHSCCDGDDAEKVIGNINAALK